MTTKQLICGETFKVWGTTEEYYAMSGLTDGSSPTNSDYTGRVGIISSSGIIKTLRLNLSVAPGTSKSIDVTLYVNGSPSILTVNVAGSDTIGLDDLNEISVSAGDTVCVRIKPNGSPATSTVSWSMDFVPDTIGETLLFSGGLGNSIFNNYFLSIFTKLSTSTESTFQLPVPCSGTFKNLYIKRGSADGNVSFTVRKNGTNQALVASLSNPSLTGNDISNNFTVSAGDIISIIKTGGTGSRTSLGLCFVPDTLGNFIFGHNNTFYGNPAIGLYFGVTSNTGQGSEISEKQVSSVCTIKNIFFLLSSAPGTGKSFTLTLRKNGVSQSLTVTIAGSDISGNAATDISISDGDLLATAKTSSGSPSSINGGFSYLGYVTPTATTIQKTILSDAKIKVEDIQKTLLSDAFITVSIQKTILSDAKIKVEDIQKTLLSDAKVIDQYQKTILSDAKIKVEDIQKTLLSDAKVAIGVLTDFNNKFNFVQQVLSDINNKINTVIRVLSDVNNFVNTCKSVVSDVINDIRTKKLILNNVNNDIRFMYSWQKAADGTIQSRGKSYIKVYIGGVEQTDVDIDSISISKDLNTAHSATFDLGRAYDATKPTMESIVSIKYNDWILFSGYIMNIAPSEDPEKMRINCQDEYWKQNKTNVYYHVGHKPTDDQELYYETLSEALTTKHDWTPGIGNFTPQLIDNFAIGKSDAISNLIQEMGNYGWFYDIDGTKKLWTAGEGSIVELKRQALGSNINLYDVINHSFDESVENIVNKFRVQMGEKVIRKFDSTGGNRTYTGYNYSSFNGFLTPAWSSVYEVISIDSGDGYGFDYPDPNDIDNYKNVFKKYNIPYLDQELSSWSDRYPPYIKVYASDSIYGASLGTITDGFTIDYENKLIIFSEPIFLYRLNSYGEPIGIRAPILKLFLFKKNYYTYTLDPTDDPETDIANPLMFFTDKMGSYSDTIIKDLNLSNLSIQEGGISIDTEGNEELIPSWDDTEFALDFANWQLSKQCDKRIRGTIEITLDAMCFYSIDLSKRIFIDGITDEALNITGITYNMANFTVSLTLENSRNYNRTVSFQSHGE